MNVKLLDLQAQYLPLREEIRAAIDQVCDAQALLLGPGDAVRVPDFTFFATAGCVARRGAVHAMLSLNCSFTPTGCGTSTRQGHVFGNLWESA